ncbi:MAG: hypothetical protein NVV82_08535 [Sporocytophaga sp.]|nr:hypothetical protein [Sporocytophaga sp.]
MPDSIKVEKPCHEDWSKMKPGGQGKHCDQCNKVVIDYTNAKEEEILNILDKIQDKESVAISGQINLIKSNRMQKAC